MFCLRITQTNFGNFEKAYGTVLRDLIPYYQEMRSVTPVYSRSLWNMYDNCKTRGQTEVIGLEIGARQESALSPFH